MTKDQATEILAKRRYNEDVSLFQKHALSHHSPLPRAKFHQQLYDIAYAGAKGRFYTLNGQPRQVNKAIIAASRFMAKSYILAFFYVLWCAVTATKKDIMIISNTGTLATNWMRKIQYEIEHNPMIRRFWGQLGGEKISPKWTEEHSVLLNGVQIQAKGYGYQIVGWHPELIVADDLETPEMAKSRDQKEKLELWFWNSLMPTIMPTDQMLVIGTLHSKMSFLNEFFEDKTGKYDDFVKLKFSAYLNGIEEEGNEMWREKFPHKDLVVIKKHNLAAYMAQYMNNPISDENAIIKPDWIKTYNRIPDMKSLVCYSAIDLAISQKETADYTAIKTIARDVNTGILYGIDFRKGRWDMKRIMDEVFNVYSTYRSVAFGFEKGIFKTVSDVIKLESPKRGLYIPIVELGITKDKVARLRAVSHYFEQGVFFIDERFKDLIDELKFFPSVRHDDGVDATAFCLSLISQNPYAENTDVELPEQKVYNSFTGY